MATIASPLRDRVTLQLRSVDRVFMHAYVPGLQTMHQVVHFLPRHGVSCHGSSPRVATEFPYPPGVFPEIR